MSRSIYIYITQHILIYTIHDYNKIEKKYTLKAAPNLANKIKQIGYLLIVILSSFLHIHVSIHFAS